MLTKIENIKLKYGVDIGWELAKLEFLRKRMRRQRSSNRQMSPLEIPFELIDTHKYSKQNYISNLNFVDFKKLILECYDEVNLFLLSEKIVLSKPINEINFLLIQEILNQLLKKDKEIHAAVILGYSAFRIALAETYENTISEKKNAYFLNNSIAYSLLLEVDLSIIYDINSFFESFSSKKIKNTRDVLNFLNEIQEEGDTRKFSFEYQIALSFAGEDREFVEKVAEILKKNNLKVFYDKYEQANLWGKDLYQYLSYVYQYKAQYCIIFISKYYAEKMWTNHELKNAQARAINNNKEYILPARFDNTDLPGLLNTIGFIDLRRTSPEELSNIVLAKIKK